MANKSENSFDTPSPHSEKQDISSLQDQEAPSQSVPTTDEEIVSAGTAFLDVIGKSLGMR